MSTILDALRKANEDQSRVRSPIMKGELYSATKIQPRLHPQQPATNGPGMTTAAMAVSALVLTATIFIVVVLWASRTAGSQQGSSSVAMAASSPAPTGVEMPAVTPPAVEEAAPANVPGQQSRRMVDSYLTSQLLPTVPVQVEIEPEPLAMRGLPAPVPLDDADFERDWTAGVEGDIAAHQEPVVVAQAPPAPSFRLEGIVWNEDNPMAIVSGAIVGVGDHVEGAEVTAITRDQVTLINNGREVVLSN